MTDAYLVVVMLVLFFLGGLAGAGIMHLVHKRRELLEYRERLRLEGRSEPSLERTGILDQVLSRFDSLEERVDFTEQLVLDRPSRRGPDPEHL